MEVRAAEMRGIYPASSLKTTANFQPVPCILDSVSNPPADAVMRARSKYLWMAFPRAYSPTLAGDQMPTAAIGTL